MEAGQAHSTLPYTVHRGALNRCGSACAVHPRLCRPSPRQPGHSLRAEPLVQQDMKTTAYILRSFLASAFRRARYPALSQ
jgi:hypothetical protein